MIYTVTDSELTYQAGAFYEALGYCGPFTYTSYFSNVTVITNSSSIIRFD